jgi:hypothetical protein
MNFARARIFSPPREEPHFFGNLAAAAFAAIFIAAGVSRAKNFAAAMN